MKRRTMAVMMAALMAMGMVSAVNVQAGVDDKTLIVGFDAEYPPYGYMDENGEYTGFDLELAQAVCDLEGWELEKKPINWDSKDMELNSGSIDCIWNGFTMNGREDEYTFSVPYVDNSQVIVVAEDSGIEKLTDLAGKTVGVQAASAALDVLKSEEEGGQKALSDTFGSLNEFADYNTAFTELQAGALDALAIDVGVAKYQIKSRGEGFVMLDESLNTEQYAIGFKKGNDELCEIVNDSKDMELNSGSIDCIWNGFTMNGREDEYTFSVPYVDNSQVIVVAEDSGIEKLTDLAGKTVGVQAASAALDVLKSEEEGGQKALADTFGSLNEFADYNTAFTELQAGALDALAIDVGVAKYQIKSRGEGFVMLDESLNTEQYAIGFKKGNDELCEIVNADLQKLADDGTVQELAEKYEIADMVTLGTEKAEDSEAE